jgi:hypothetical protein
MAGESPNSKAHQAIGAYFCAFSVLERELGEAIKVIFRLQQHEAADTIVAALGDVAKKINLVRSAILIAKNVDGSDTSEEWKTRADATMKTILGCNGGDRVALAHSYLEPRADGSVTLTSLQVPDGVLKNKQDTWTEADFKRKTERLAELTEQLRSLKNDLSTFTVTIPNTGWMTSYWDTPFALRHAALTDDLSHPPWAPPPLAGTEKKEPG